MSFQVSQLFADVFVVAHLSVLPKIVATSVTIVEVNADPLFVMGVDGRYECFVIISFITLATFGAVASINGQANIYLENTSIAVITLWYPSLVCKFGSRSICMASSGPRSHSGKFSNSSVIKVFGTNFSLAHVSQPSTYF